MLSHARMPSHAPSCVHLTIVCQRLWHQLLETTQLLGRIIRQVVWSPMGHGMWRTRSLNFQIVLSKQSRLRKIWKEKTAPPSVFSWPFLCWKSMTVDSCWVYQTIEIVSFWQQKMLPFKSFRGSAPNPLGGTLQTPSCKADLCAVGYAPVSVHASIHRLGCSIFTTSNCQGK